MTRKLSNGGWGLALCDCIFSGLFPLFAVIWLFQSPESGVTAFGFVVTVLLCSGIVAAAIGTIYLNNFSRYALLALVTVYWSQRFLFSGNTLSSEGITQENLALAGDLWRPFFWIGLNWWFWLKSSTVTLFKPQA